MKKPKITKPKIRKVDLSKVPFNDIEDELARRIEVENGKAREKEIKDMYKSYLRRGHCEVLDRAYLPSSYGYNPYKGIDKIDKFEVANLNFANGKEYSYASKFELNVCDTIARRLRKAIGVDNKRVKEFWKKMDEEFKSVVEELFKDPAYLAAMIAESSDEFELNEDRANSEEIKYYNKIVLEFNKAVIKRFKNYTDEELKDALIRLKTRELGFGADEEDAEDVIIGVLKTRGYKLMTNREKWDRYDETGKETDWGEEDEDSEEEDD